MPDASLRSTTPLLLVVCLAQFMVVLDVAVVNVALPSMRSDLDLSTAGLQWVVNAYTLTFGGFLLLGGRLADLLGRRRVLLAGVAAFSAASLVCALAGSPGLLWGARALQGLAGAVVSPATLSIITSSLPEGPQRNRGLATWAAISGLGASSGAILGGILTQAFGWPAIFAVNVPLGAVVIALGLRVIPAPRDTGDAARHFDASGAVLVTAGLTAIAFAIVRTETLAWGSPGVLGPLAAGIALVAAFAFVEARVARAPLVPLSILRLRGLRAANLVVALLYAALFSMFFFVTLFLQRVLDQSALQAGASFVPLTLSVFAGSSITPRLVDRFGLRAVLGAGMLLPAAGLGLLTGVSPGDPYLAAVLPGGVLACLGMGIALVAGTIAGTEGVPGAQAGLASGLLNTARLMGGALGLAVLSTLAANHTRAADTGRLQALTDGFSLAFAVGALFCLAGAVAAAVLLRRPGRGRLRGGGGGVDRVRWRRCVGHARGAVLTDPTRLVDAPGRSAP